MGFHVEGRQAIIYDEGTERFTGTTLEGIGQAVVGVLQHSDKTVNRFVKVMSILTCQNELLEAFQSATESEWEVQRWSSQALKKSGQTKFQAGIRGWVLEMVVAQLFDQGEARCLVAPSRGVSDSDMLGVPEESPLEVVKKVMKRR